MCMEIIARILWWTWPLQQLCIPSLYIYLRNDECCCRGRKNTVYLKLRVSPLSLRICTVTSQEGAIEKKLSNVWVVLFQITQLFHFNPFNLFFGCSMVRLQPILLNVYNSCLFERSLIKGLPDYFKIWQNELQLPHVCAVALLYYASDLAFLYTLGHYYA